ncbi:MAG: hypothetical protein IPP58_15435 [Holophagaceae bacterium]|uniref:Uncharacterized protein n=1 Tax=Candidatus Geothrix skivensis TaxID=2954439 RepID=A0A9D7XMR7_9BACT|nr:hypothetical protein [Candidatus Geothrix skivensis]
MGLPLLSLLVVPLLAAQGPASLDLRPELGADPAGLIRLAPTGCWDGLFRGLAPRPAAAHPRRLGEATVEVLDFLPLDWGRHEALLEHRALFRERLLKAFALPPPKLQSLELSEIMQSDPTQPQKLDLTKVKSMQDRFNRLPPGGSPVK